MTNIKIVRQNKSIVSIVCDGHTNYGVLGEDIVCAALSSIVQTALLGLMQVSGIPITYQRDEKKGYLSFVVGEISATERHDADIVLDTMLCGLLDLYETYSDFIQVQIEDKF